MNRPPVMTSSEAASSAIGDRIQQRQQVDRHPQPHRPGLGGEAGGGDGRLDRLELVEQEMLPERDQVEPKVTRQAHLLDRVLELLG